MSDYSLANLLAGRRALICAPATATVGEAVALLLTHRVGQLPVVDGDGRLLGLVSQQSILSIYFYANGAVDLLRLPVGHCLDPAVTLDKQEGLLAAVDRLRTRGVAAVVVTDGDKPVGILTGRDMTHFFRSLFEGMLMVEQIETTLRECVAVALPQREALVQAAIHAFGPSKGNPNVPLRSPDGLSFTALIRLISAEANWRVFDPLLGPKQLFDPLMERVRQVRNEIAHFQGRPDSLELDLLRRAVQWLGSRRSVPVTTRKRAALPLLPDVKLHPLTELLAQRNPPLCIGEDATIGAVLQQMVEYGYAQLPVVNADGQLRGMVYQTAILNLYYFTKGDAPLLTMNVSHVLERAAELAADDTLFRAVEALTSPGIAAAVTVRDGVPVGILTGKDMTHFFRTLFEGIILVERVELTLREHVQRAYPDEDALNAAAIAAFGRDPENPHYAIRNPHKLSFGDRLLMIADDDNWPRFEPVLGPRIVFMHLMEGVRQVRNDLMHFKGQLEVLERDALLRADSWLGQRPAWPG